MKELFEYAKELAKITKFEENDLLNAISTLRELKVPEESIKLLIERSNAIGVPMRLMELVNIIFHDEIEQRRKWNMELLSEFV